MNNLHQQKFQFLRFTEDGPNQDIYGKEVWDTEKVFLSLTSRESYSQYLDLGLDTDENIDGFYIESESGEKLTLGIHFYYNIRKIDSKHILIFGLKDDLKYLGCNTLYCVITTSKRKIFSNVFNFIHAESELNDTTLLTYWHKENYYNANYFESDFIPQQIRVPIAFSHNYSEGEAESYQDSYQVENKYRSGRVKRLFMESWKVLMNDSNYTALCTALDSDFVYFDNIFVSLKPFTPERDKDEKGFSLSSIDGQRNPLEIFDQSILSQYFNISADSQNYSFNYNHEPINLQNSGESFLVNKLFNNYKNDFGVIYNCDLKIKITKLPIKGFLAHNITRNIFSTDSVISYCEKDNLVYFPNGFNNNLGSSGNFSETFKYRIIDTNGNVGSEIEHSINMIDTAVTPPVNGSSMITFFDNTTSPIVGNNTTIEVIHLSTVIDPSDSIVSQKWEQDNGNGFQEVGDLASPFNFNLNVGENKIRLKTQTQNEVFYSNILIVTRIQNTYPLQNFYFQAIHPDTHSGIDYVVYLDEYGMEQTLELIRSRWNDFNNDGIEEVGEWLEAPCMLVSAYQIVETFGAMPCTP